MGQKGQTTTYEERVQIAERAQAGQSSRKIAEEIGYSLATVRKWRQRYGKEGRSGLSRRMGRPCKGALGRVPEEMKQALLAMRDQHPGWGAETLRLEINKEEQFAGQTLPSRSRIAAYLKEHKKVRKYARHQDLPAPEPQRVQRPHQEWEMDAQGATTVAGIGKVSFINLLDVYSHVSIDSHACPHLQHPRSGEYQQLLRRAFLHYGLPEQISLDHDSAFFDNKSASPFPSVLHLWLIGLGVQVRFIEHQPPLEHARIERHHQTIAGQAFLGQTFPDISALQRNLQARLLFLNREYPTLALDQHAPFQVFPYARHSGRRYSPETEEDCLDLQRIYTFLQLGRWFRQVSSKGFFYLGGYQYNATPLFAEQTLQVTFDPVSLHLICLPEKSSLPFQLVVQGLTKASLMGDRTALPSLTAFQLPLPFSCPDMTF